MIIISGCLLGINCRYDGTCKISERFFNILGINFGILLPICPEQLGGLPTPRDKASIIGGDGLDVIVGKARVLTDKGLDVTQNFIKGAEETLWIAKLYSVDKAILKSKSPSCGYGPDGYGVCAALLKRNGISIFNENDPLNYFF